MAVRDQGWTVFEIPSTPGQYRPLQVVARTPPLLLAGEQPRRRHWLTPSTSSWSLPNDGRNMVVVRRRLFFPLLPSGVSLRLRLHPPVGVPVSLACLNLAICSRIL